MCDFRTDKDNVAGSGDEGNSVKLEDLQRASATILRYDTKHANPRACSLRELRSALEEMLSASREAQQELRRKMRRQLPPGSSSMDERVRKCQEGLRL